MVNTELPVVHGNGNARGTTSDSTDTFTMKTGLARMLKGGVIMDVVNAEQVYCSFTLISKESSPF